jgi:hypothetical protein
MYDMGTDRMIVLGGSPGGIDLKFPQRIALIGCGTGQLMGTCDLMDRQRVTPEHAREDEATPEEIDTNNYDYAGCLLTVANASAVTSRPAARPLQSRSSRSNMVSRLPGYAPCYLWPRRLIFKLFGFPEEFHGPVTDGMPSKPPVGRHAPGASCNETPDIFTFE